MSDFSGLDSGEVFGASRLPTDAFGRTVVVAPGGWEPDTYSVLDTDLQTVLFSVTFPPGTPQADVYNTINALAPEGWVPPEEVEE